MKKLTSLTLRVLVALILVTGTLAGCRREVSPRVIERIGIDSYEDSYFWDSADLYFYSDDHSTQQYHVDGATGNLTGGAGSFTLSAAEKVLIDGSTTANTGTAGIVDINHATIITNASAVNIAHTTNTGTQAAADTFGMVMTLTQNDADADAFGISITAAATTNAAAGSYEAGILYDCAENTAGACLDGVRLTAGTATGMTDGVDASDADIVNALNAGVNDILLGDETLDVAVDDSFRFTRNDSGSVTLICADDDANAECIYDSGGTGNVQIGSADTGKVTVYATDDVTIDLTSSTDAEDLVISQDGNHNASILISAEGSGADAVKIETITNDGDIVISSVDNLQLTSTSASGLIDIDGTAGLVYSIAEDDTTADDIDLGSAKDDMDIEGEDITLDTADDMDFAVADDLVVTIESASGKFEIAGTAGSDIDIATDDTTADSIDIGSAKDDVLISGEDITLDTADDADVLVADDFTFTMETAANIWSVTGTPGFVVNVCTDDTTADDINIGSAKDDVDVLGTTIDLIGSVRLVDNSAEIDGSGTGNTVLTWKDYDCDDDDDNATVTVNCTTATTGAEDCDWTLAVQEAGTADNRITVDADLGVTIGSANNDLITLTTDGTGDAELAVPENSIGPDELAVMVDQVIFCGDNANSGTIYGGPATAWLSGDGSDASLNSTACQALDNATEATADAPIGFANTAFKVLGMLCEVDTAGSNGVTLTLRDDASDLTPSVTCTIATGQTTCTSVTASTTDVAADSAMAIKSVTTEDLSGNDFWCKIFIAYK